MPFGVKDPFKVNSKGRRLIQTDSYDTCPVCTRELTVTADVTPVAPIKIPEHEQDGFESIMILGCQQCYMAQKRLNFHSLESLIDYRTTKRIARSVKIETEKPPVDKPIKPARYVSSKKKAVFNGISLEHLESLYESLGKVIKAIKDAKNIAPEEENPPTPEPGTSDIDLDDIEAGMTDEQRAKMNQAVEIAKSREGKVPQEAPDGW